MAPKADAPLRRVVLHLYAEDCEKLKKMQGYGWTVAVRHLVRGAMSLRYDEQLNRTRGENDKTA